VLVLSLGLVSCLEGPNFPPKPESVLFNRGSNALDRSQFDVAALDFQTLTHTHMFTPSLLCDEGTTTTNSIQ